MEHTPLLSVTVLNYNYAHFLPTCLDSILKQTFTDFEVILINDKSTDNSLEVIQPYLSDPRVRLVDHKDNKRFVGSLVEGVELSRGKYMTVISADDWILDDSAFMKQITALERNPQVAFAFTAYGLYEDEQTRVHITRAANASFIRPGVDVFKEFVLTTVPLHSGTILRRSSYDAIGGYDTKIVFSLDAQIFLGMCHAGDIAYIDEILYAYRRHRSSMSKSVSGLQQAITEVFDILDWSFGMLSPFDRKRLAWVKRKAEQRALTAFAVDAVFSNQYKLGWSFYMVGLRMRPLQTIFQRSTMAIVLRTLIGQKGFAMIERMKASRFLRRRAMADPSSR